METNDPGRVYPNEQIGRHIVHVFKSPCISLRDIHNVNERRFTPRPAGKVAIEAVMQQAGLSVEAPTPDTEKPFARRLPADGWEGVPVVVQV